MKKNKIINLLSLVLLLLSTLSCSSTTEPPDEFPEIEGVELELGEHTTFVESHVAEAGLNSYDEEHHVFRFDAGVVADAGLNLEEGAILFIEELALRRITSITESGGELVVETEVATLNEAFRHASVESRQTIEFTPQALAQSKVEFMGKLYNPTSVSSDSLYWEHQWGDFTFEVLAMAQQTELDITIVVRYSVGDVSGAMRTETNLKGFEQEISFEIENHNAEWFRNNSAGLEGTTDLYFIFAGGHSNETSYTPDVPRLLLPFTVGPIPILLEIGTIFVTQFNLGVNGTAQLGTSFSYSGDMGFQFDGVEFTSVVDGGVREPDVTEIEGTAAGFSGVVNGQYGIAIPNVGLRMALIPTAYIRQEFYIGALYAFPTCTELFSQYKINAGITIGNALGFDILDFLNRDWELVDVTPHSYRSDGCDPDKRSEFEFVSIPPGYMPEEPQVPYQNQIKTE